MFQKDDVRGGAFRGVVSISLESTSIFGPVIYTHIVVGLPG